MAETYTDSTGKVFPLNAFGRPQGYWDGNKFVFPQFGTQSAAAVPAVDPVAPVVPDPVAQPMQRPGMVVQPIAEGDSEAGPPSGPPGGVTAPPANTFGTTEYSTNLSKNTGGVLGPNTALDRGALYGGIGSRIGGFTGIPGAGILGGAIGSHIGGRGGFGIGGDVVGSLLGSALLGPLGAVGGGIVGGRMGDLIDMETTLGLSDRGTRDALGILGYGFGLGQSIPEQLEDYYGINQTGIDPFSGGLDIGPPSGRSVGFDDIGDVDPNAVPPDTSPFSDPFGDIAAALGGDGDSTTGGDTTADDGVGFEP